MELNSPRSSLQCSIVLTIGNWERHFVKVFCADGCQNTLRGLERGKESGFRCHGHAVAMVTTHSTFLQPLLNKGAFEKVFIWTKSKHFTHCVYEFSLDRRSRHGEFRPEGKAVHLMCQVSSGFSRQVNRGALLNPTVKTLPSFALSAWCPAVSPLTWWLRLRTASTRPASPIPPSSPRLSNRSPAVTTSAPRCMRKHNPNRLLTESKPAFPLVCRRLSGIHALLTASF